MQVKDLKVNKRAVQIISGFDDSVIRVESRFKTAAYSLINATILLTDVNDNPSVILHLDGHQNKLHLNVSEILRWELM
ncbi:hypothetical protein Bpfe_029188 [Biomphalaria pfeifferi]|uniref:Uncharacterized protein n=1 Tax=Biomphalaria pfeifferi TaxID=112525 RepID=A0AAD8EV08_BIOPF|nr:hypothetical protein Bpfe_029188 [Biomphalaria pfeifferi]